MSQTKIIAFSGSTRSGSVNTRLLGAAVKELTQSDCEITRISLADYPLPLYDGDLEAKDGIPENAKKLAKLLNANDGMFITCPEYNGSLSPLMKNTIDWISRVSEVDGEKVSPFRGKVCAIASCSPGGMGGISMLYHLREILVRLGVLVISEQVAVGNAGSAFDDMDSLTDERTAGFLSATCKSLYVKARSLKEK